MSELVNGWPREELLQICDYCKRPKGEHYPRADWLCPKQPPSNKTFFRKTPTPEEAVWLSSG